MIQTPLWLATGAFIKVANFRFQNTQITLGQLQGTGKAVTLGIGFFCALATVTAKNFTRVLDFDISPDERSKVKLHLAEQQLIPNW